MDERDRPPVELLTAAVAYWEEQLAALEEDAQSRSLTFEMEACLMEMRHRLENARESLEAVEDLYTL